MHVFSNYTVLWFKPAPHSLLLPSCGMGERIRSLKVGKLSAQDKNSLIGKAKEELFTTTTTPGQADAQPSPGQQGSIMFNGEGW